MEKPNNETGVKFGSHTIAGVAGVLGGVAFAIGVPWVLLAHGQILGATVLTWLVSGAIAGGCLISLTAAFFSLVMPSSVNHYDQWNRDQKLISQND
jgi:apolipoprotein N-acyltransferase